MYICEICGTRFDEPLIREWKEPRPDGFREKFRQVLCPVCGEPHFHEEDGDDK